MFYVCLGTNGAQRSGTIIEMKAINCSMKTFNAYMSHQAVRQSDCRKLTSVASNATAGGGSKIDEGGGTTVTSSRYMPS